MFLPSLDNILQYIFAVVGALTKMLLVIIAKSSTGFKFIYYKGLFKAKGRYKRVKKFKYLLRALKADSFYLYFKEENRSLTSIDSPEWIDFFINKETIQPIYLNTQARN